MNLLISIIGAISAIFIVVVIHEFGHFITARWFGVKVLRFSIGFGRPIWSHVGKKSGTEFAIGWMPLGGYVKMLGDSDEDIQAHEKSLAYGNKAIWQRMLIVLAGPITNFILALIVLWVAFLMGVTQITPTIGKILPNSVAAKAGLVSNSEIVKIDNLNTPTWQHVTMALITRMGDKGEMTMTTRANNASALTLNHLNLAHWQVNPLKPNLFKSLGFYPYRPLIPPVIARVMPGSAAAKARLQKGDRIVSANGQPVRDWYELFMDIQKQGNKPISLIVQRGSQRLTVIVTPQKKRLGIMSVAPQWPKGMVRKPHYNVLSAFVPAADQVWTLSYFNALVLWKIIIGKISFKTLGGPVSVFKMAGEASASGLLVYLGFIAFISLTLGFINILPIPMLDGGHFLFQIIELIIRRPIPLRVQAILMQIGLAILLIIMINATINDVLRLVS